MAEYEVVVINPGYESYDIERELLQPLGAEIIVAEKDCDTEDLIISTAQDADAILVREGPVTGRVIASLNKLKVIARYGVGVDNVDLETARQRKVYACIVPNYGKIARVFHRKWQGFLPACVLVFDPFVDAATIRNTGAEKVDLDTLLVEADYISVHAPLTPETRHIINAAALKKMKSTAVIVNTSRGAIIDTVALANALAKGEIFAARIDVFEKEPLPADHPLVSIPNVILTPHLAWYSKESTRDLQTGAALEVKRVLSGELPQNWANKWS